MAKRKLERFAAIKTFPNVTSYLFGGELPHHLLKGKWHSDFFKNDHPLVLELGCGKGEYCVGLAQRYPEKNFLGLDIKGARMFIGAKQALDQNIRNAGFIRTRIDFITSCFAENEVDEIWITFPDPQLQKPRKRLTSPLFLSRYRQLLKPGGIIHLKTDNVELHRFTLEVIKKEGLELIDATEDVYGDPKPRDPVLREIQTTYEKRFLGEGMKITYVSFRLRSI